MEKQINTHTEREREKEKASSVYGGLYVLRV